jgi:hypothetical protein
VQTCEGSWLKFSKEIARKNERRFRRFKKNERRFVCKENMKEDVLETTRNTINV